MVQHTTNRPKLTPYITFHRILISIVWINALVLAVVVAFDHSTSTISSFSSSRRRPVLPDATTAIVGAAGSDASTVSSDFSINNNNNNNSNSNSNSVSRRKLFTGISTTATAAALSLSPLILFSSSPPPVHAFTNAIPEAKKYGDRPKRKGTAPKDLGVLSRTTEGRDTSITSPRLRTCDGNPNCFSTTGDLLLEDRQMYGVDFLIPAWVPPPTNKDDESSRKLNSIDTIAAVMQTYEPGQGGIDGGGFTVIKRTESYLYYQFEALKKGYVDDVEFALLDPKNPLGGIQVRSGSRVGVTDFGVNAIRLNYIAKQLQTKYGWSIPEITADTHRDYWITATEAQEATFDEDRRNY
ncbi:hypothetical protein FRACYDRAFT_235354 [Fragilariopsis cylindrus CCMP1102]|uniref:Uncharacterized protein n=1 Tax=Fragilariopsis cylindrus CCMP1102 TaxID=635003 RepID=A0A1E7FMK3_9STRA|nr:hypothetical protein FRACYDRAFT_235354 [Fragilariopsis cylindrus CCMP1102]|eukprot:OEU19305.1 hypothetical protein FRACYDRAFT_235354 [Fragilariopsis cylindrus CCMP1102]